MRNNKYVPLIVLLVSICAMAFLYGCGSVTSGGGGGGGGGATAAWTYFGNNNDNCIYYISPEGLNISGTIELGCYVPYYMTKSKDNTKLYVSTASNEVLVIDTGKNAITQLITLDAPSQSKAMKVSDDGKYLYMGDSGTNLYKIDLTNGAITSEGVGGTVIAIALKPDGSEIYYCNGSHINLCSTAYYFSPINPLIDLGGASMCYDMTVKDGKVYAPLYNTLTGECIIIDTTNDSWTSITSEGDTFFGAVAIPGTDEVYVSSRKDPGFIYIINTLVPTFEGTSISSTELYNPDFMAATKDGKYVGVMDGVSGHLKVGWIDTSSREVIDYSVIPESDMMKNNIVFIYK